MPRPKGGQYEAFIDGIKAQSARLCPGCGNYAPHGGDMEPGLAADLCPGRTFKFGGNGPNLRQPYAVEIDGALESEAA